MFGFVIWDIDPDFSLWGEQHIRFYGLMYVLGFIIAYFVLRPIFKKEGKDFYLTIKLMWAIVMGTLIGGRLGHCLFYETAYYLKHPLEILTHWNSGVASHGAALGILIALIIYSKFVAKNVLLWSFDRALLVLALGAALVRVGNLTNSEIYGYPTQSKMGFVFVRDTQLGRAYHNHKAFKPYMEELKYAQRSGKAIMDGKAYPIEIEMSLSPKLASKEMVTQFVNRHVLPRLHYRINEKGEETNIFIRQGQENAFKVIEDKGLTKIKISAYGIPKHPTQLYEAWVYFILFGLLLYLYHVKGVGARPGIMSGVFLIIMFTSRFLLEFLKQNQVAKEEAMLLNMGQQLSIPFIILGIGFMYRALKSNHCR